MTDLLWEPDDDNHDDDILSLLGQSGVSVSQAHGKAQPSDRQVGLYLKVFDPKCTINTGFMVCSHEMLERNGILLLL